MSVTVSSCFQIHNSPLNQSTSKQLFSFPKAKRFSQMRKINCQQIYSLPSQKDQRAAGIGYGSRINMARPLSVSPAPNVVKISQTFRLDHRSWTRSQISDSLIMLYQSSKQFGIFQGYTDRYPGPGTYRSLNTLSNIKYTLRPKTSIRSPSEKLNAPGPQERSYKSPETLNENGRYAISKFRNSGAPRFNPQSSSRFSMNCKNKVPGPGAYKAEVQINPVGRYFPSKHKNSQARSFNHSLRQSLSTPTITPGPGNYQLPSDFGHYVSSKVVGKQNQ